jgi:hypothetical protein
VSRARSLVVGLAERDRSTTVERYFAAFRWEVPAFDPESLSASAFLALLDGVDDEPVELSAGERHNNGGASNE